MKEQKPKGKSQIPQSGPQAPDVELSPLRRQDDDVDFEILDALEQIEQVGKGAGDSLPDDEDAIALNLDDEDLVFDDDDEIPETEEFHFDDDLSASLDSEASAEDRLLAEDDEDADTDAQDESQEDEAFPLDLDDEEAANMGISFDEDIDLQFDAKFEDASFDLEESEEVSEDDEMLDFGDEASETMPDAALPEEFAETEKSLDDVNFEELPEMDESFEFESQIDDDSVVSAEESAMLVEKDAAVFPGKTVISVAGDQVIDLGDEQDLEETAMDEFSEFSEDTGLDQEAEMDLAGLEADAQKILSSIVAEQSEDTEEPETESVEDVKAEKQFMASLEDVDIDLEEDVVDMFDASEEEGEMDMAEPTPESSEEAVRPAAFGLDEAIEDLHAQSLEAELREEGLAAIAFDLSPQELRRPVSEEDQLKALGLVPRLTDAEIKKFEHLVTEAKTLQFYAEKLTIHQSEINPRIYQKLSKEYAARKMEIFREPEFISIRIDVEQDLHDMLAKRSNFTTTIARLNEELEEVKVRHLVGEFTDAMLADKQRAQQTEILEWQQKMDVLGALIERYQELLDTAHVLNPLEDEKIAAVETALRTEEPPEVELEEALAAEETFLEESGIEDIAADESPSDILAELPSFPEEDLEVAAETLESETDDIEASGVIVEDLDKEMADLETLTSIFDEEDSSEWETEAEADTELSPEGFDEQEFALETGTEEDFEIESFADIEDELSSQLAGVEEADEDEASALEPTITCKKCGRATPAAEKFCVNCGAKAR